MIKNNDIYDSLRFNCIELIKEKNINIQELTFDLGISEQEFYKVFNERCEDITIYLKTYNLLIKR